jgi:hypothetical protein
MNAIETSGIANFMTKCASMACAGALLLSTSPALAIPLAGTGTATIDGVINSTEWSGAATLSFSANLPTGGTTPALLYVMNDATNLYFGLSFAESTPYVGSLGFEFNADNTGVFKYGDDAIVYNNETKTLYDDFYSNGPWGMDSLQGGTNDGTGAFSTNGTTSFYEMSHPLSSGDPLHDFTLSAGQTIGFNLFLRMIAPGANYPNGYGDTSYPSVTGFSQLSIVDVPAPPVPEPETYAMFLAGLGLVGYFARHRRD